MTPNEVMDGLHLVARTHLDYEGLLAPDTSIVEVLELDSLRMLTLVVEVENHFKICLEDGDEQELVTVSDLAKMIQERLNEHTE